jgi:MFS family permease
MALWRTPVVALVADVTPSPFRSQASGVLNFMAGIGAILAYFGGAALFKQQAAFPFWMGALVVLVATLLMVAFVREPKTYQTDEIAVSEAQPGFIESLKLIFQEQDKSALYLLLATFCLMVSYSAVEGL